MLIPSETSLEKSQSLRSDSRRWLRPNSSSLRELIEEEVTTRVVGSEPELGIRAFGNREIVQHRMHELLLRVVMNDEFREKSAEMPMKKNDHKE
jgi:hypothetical protein